MREERKGEGRRKERDRENDEKCVIGRERWARVGKKSKRDVQRRLDWSRMGERKSSTAVVMSL